MSTIMSTIITPTILTNLQAEIIANEESRNVLYAVPSSRDWDHAAKIITLNSRIMKLHGDKRKLERKVAEFIEECGEFDDALFTLWYQR